MTLFTDSYCGIRHELQVIQSVVPRLCKEIFQITAETRIFQITWFLFLVLLKKTHQNKTKKDRDTVPSVQLLL